MTESKAFSSLFALVDSHLSNISLQESPSDSDKTSLEIQSLNANHHGSVSEAHISSARKQTIPKICMSDSPISQILANQVTNLLLAKEKRKQEEEQKRLEKENMKTTKDDFVIDLMQALQQSSGKMSTPTLLDSSSTSSSCERLFDIQFMDCDDEAEGPEEPVKPEPLLPCTVDMSYILNVKTQSNKCSTFGKVLTAKEKPVPGLYMHEKFNSNIEIFSFKTPSPCDIIKTNLRKPTISCNYTVSIF